MKKYLMILGLFVFTLSCSDLDGELQGKIDPEAAAVEGNVSLILEAAYQALDPFASQDQSWALEEHTSDEAAGPTRGPDWDDGGIWRQLHRHTWSSSHPLVNTTWGNLLSGVFKSTQVLEFNPTPQQAAEAKFLRAFFSFNVLDLWGIMLLREPGEDLTLPPSILLNRTDGIDFIIDDLESILADLPETNDNGRATKDAARVLLAKAYLNKAVYKATNADGGAQKGPFTFASSDMDQVIKYCDEIIASGRYSLDENYYDNFRPENTSLSSENIFVINNERGSATAQVNTRYFMTHHPNQTPEGWNGFNTLAELYDSFDASDTRRGLPHQNFPELNGKTGVDAGFLFGQQFDKDGNPLKDRTNQPLAFTKDFNLDNSDEIRGIRINKYFVDFENIFAQANDYVFFRYADVLLMKAEAIMRGGTPTGGQTAASIVNDLRDIRGATTPFENTLIALLAERAREFYWEGFRRTDQIRFGTFLDAFQEKPASTEKFLLFPIPPGALSLNPNLTQNPGY